MMRHVESVWILKTVFGKAEAPNPKVLKTGQSQPQVCCSRFKRIMTDTDIEETVFIWGVLDIESKLKDCLYCFRTWDLTAGHHRPLLCKLLSTPLTIHNNLDFCRISHIQEELEEALFCSNNVLPHIKLNILFLSLSFWKSSIISVFIEFYYSDLSTCLPWEHLLTLNIRML